jgi:hypothetical protein
MMRTLLTVPIVILAAAGIHPASLSAQLPSGCLNNETSRCAQRMALSTIVEGLAGDLGNHNNFFEVQVLRPGIYSLEMTKERAPGGGAASLRVFVVDSQGNRLLDRWFNNGLEFATLVEIRVPEKYYISVHYTSGSVPTPFTLRFRPRARN